jgi:hypothetical protein
MLVLFFACCSACALVIWPHRGGELVAASSRALLNPTVESLALPIASGQGYAMVQLDTSDVDAADWAFLELEVQAMPRTHSLMLSITQGGQRDQRVLPQGRHVFPLRRMPSWTGTAPTLSFLLVPDSKLAIAAAPAAQVQISAVRLLSGGLWSAWRTSLSEWFAYRPWLASSINGEGAAYAGRGGPSLPLLVFLCAVCAVCLAPAPRLRWIAPVAVGGWMVLYLPHLAQLTGRSIELHTQATVAEASGGLQLHARLAGLVAGARPSINALQAGVPLAVWSSDHTSLQYMPYLLTDVPAARLPDIAALALLAPGAELVLLVIEPDHLPPEAPDLDLSAAGVPLQQQTLYRAPDVRLLRLRRPA